MNQLEVFKQYQSYLFSIAYRMLGSVMEAEDMVQEVFLRWQKETNVDIQSPKAYLTAIVTRLCIDHLRLAQVKREEYIGPWLPEPLLTDASQNVGDTVELKETLSLAFLLLMESLTPVERAVFLLHEIFSYSHAEIAKMTGLGEANCRQILHRAKQSVEKKRSHTPVAADEQRRLFSQFLQASANGDMQGLLSLLASDIALYSDGGGKRSVARYPVRGSKNVAAFILGLLDKTSGSLQVVISEVNAHPAIFSYINSELFGVLALNIVGDRITDIYFQANPEKLTTIPSQP